MKNGVEAEEADGSAELLLLLVLALEKGQVSEGCQRVYLGASFPLLSSWLGKQGGGAFKAEGRSLEFVVPSLGIFKREKVCLLLKPKSSNGALPSQPNEPGGKAVIYLCVE